MPKRDHVTSGQSSRWLRPILNKPYLWHLNRRSVAKGLSMGLFWSMLPVFGQSVPAAILTWKWRGNVPLSIVGCWISNPFTLIPHWWAGYSIGRFVLQQPRPDIQFNWEFWKDKWNDWHWLWAHFWSFYVPLFAGCIVLGLILGLISYFGILIWWKWHAGNKWRARHAAAA